MSETREGREAGRALDAEIAERVLSWSGRTIVRKRGRDEREIAFKATADKRGIGTYEVWYTEDGTKLYCGKPWAPHFPGRYSTDMRAAFEVVEAMRAKGWHVYFASSDPANGGVWVASFVGDGIGGFLAHADTLPLAICRAALDAIAAAHSPAEAQLKTSAPRESA